MTHSGSQSVGSHFEKTVIILSSGRTGTTAMAKYLNEAFEGVHAVHEPKPSRHLRIASFAYLGGRYTNEQMIAKLTRARTKLCATVGQPIYIESNPYLTGFLDVLGEVFDHPKIVHITRDPRTTIRSALNFGSQRGLKRFFSAVVPYWIIKPEQLEENPKRTWSQMSLVERFAWYWRVVNTHLNRGQELYCDDYLRIRYEDLFRPSGDGIRQLADWIGLAERPGVLNTLLTERVNRSSRNATPAWETWSDRDKQSVIDHGESLMATYGYPIESVMSIDQEDDAP